VSGALNLTSNLVFRVEGTILASTSPSSYPVVPALEGYGTCRDRGYPAAHAHSRHQALLSGWNITNAWLDGGGTGVIDGRAAVGDAKLGTSWVGRFKAETLDYGRPRLWEPMFSAGVAAVDITFTNQAFWAVHPYACQGVYIGGVNVSAPRDEGIPNDDGIDPDSSEEVLVERCDVDVGDNSVAIKSGMDRAGRAFGRAAANIVFRDSTFVCETFAIGSEMSGDARARHPTPRAGGLQHDAAPTYLCAPPQVFNVTVERCAFGGRGSDFAGVHLKSQRGRGGSVHDVAFRHVTFDMRTSTKQRMAFSASLFYHKTPPTNATATPEVHSVSLSDATVLLPAASASPVFGFVGLPEVRREGRGGAGPRGQEGWSEVISYGQSRAHVRASSTAPCSCPRGQAPLRNFAFTDVRVVAGASSAPSAWSCADTRGFTFAGNVTPPPLPASNCTAAG